MSEDENRLDLTIKKALASVKKLSPSPGPCPDQETLAAYHEGNLSPDEVERIEAHITSCDRCTEGLVAFSGAVTSYNETQESLATKKMISKAKRLVKAPQGLSLFQRFSSRFSSLTPAPLVAMSSVVLLLVVLGIYTLHSPYETPQEKAGRPSFTLVAKLPSGMEVRGTTPGFKEVEVPDGGVLHSGDMFKLRFELQKDAYVYLLALDSGGNITILFPGANAEKPPKISANRNYMFPEKDQWLMLDKNTGQERFYLIVSPEPIGDIEKRIARLKEVGIDRVVEVFPEAKVQPLSFKHK
jgi:hypothetical protein